MDPRVCPPALNSSQSVMSNLDKSPSGGFKAGHSRNDSAGSSRNSRQVVSEPFLFIKSASGVCLAFVYDVSPLYTIMQPMMYVTIMNISMDGWLNG